MEFLLYLNVKPPCTKVKPPIDDFLAMVLVIHKLLWMLQTSKRQLKTEVPHLKSTELNRIQVTTLTCCSIRTVACECLQ